MADELDPTERSTDIPLFSSPSGAPAPERARLPKTTTGALIDPFTVLRPQPVADVDRQPGAAESLGVGRPGDDLPPVLLDPNDVLRREA